MFNFNFRFELNVDFFFVYLTLIINKVNWYREFQHFSRRYSKHCWINFNLSPTSKLNGLITNWMSFFLPPCKLKGYHIRNYPPNSHNIMPYVIGFGFCRFHITNGQNSHPLIIWNENASMSLTIDDIFFLLFLLMDFDHRWYNFMYELVPFWTHAICMLFCPF